MNEKKLLNKQERVCRNCKYFTLGIVLTCSKRSGVKANECRRMGFIGFKKRGINDE